jgi:hypothetical protein
MFTAISGQLWQKFGNYLLTHTHTHTRARAHTYIYMFTLGHEEKGSIFLQNTRKYLAIDTTSH